MKIFVMWASNSDSTSLFTIWDDVPTDSIQPPDPTSPCLFFTSKTTAHVQVMLPAVRFIEIGPDDPA